MCCARDLRELFIRLRVLVSEIHLPHCIRIFVQIVSECLLFIHLFHPIANTKPRPSIAPGPPDGLQRKLSDKKSERFFVSHVSRALLKFNRMLTEAPELDPFRESVHKAGCKVSSDWANGACLFVPLPNEKAEEADWMLDEKHVVIRSENMPTLAEALRLFLKKLMPIARRPTLLPSFLQLAFLWHSFSKFSFSFRLAFPQSAFLQRFLG